jgi:hypothetical protein
MKVEKFCLVGLVLLLSMFVTSVFAGDGRTIRWDILREAAAVAHDTSEIILTGSGTVVLGQKDHVTGGGKWYIIDPNGNLTDSGDYEVTGLVYYAEAPGSNPNDPTARAGLLVLRVAYSNEKEGLLTVGCHIRGTPSIVFEGITAMMGFVDYLNFEEAPTAFHVVR